MKVIPVKKNIIVIVKLTETETILKEDKEHIHVIILIHNTYSYAKSTKELYRVRPQNITINIGLKTIKYNLCDKARETL